MADIRANSANLVLLVSAPHGAMHVYHDRHPIRDMLDPSYFLPVRNSLQSGDILVVQQIARRDDGTMRVVAHADTVVVESKGSGVELSLRGDVVTVPQPKTGYSLKNQGATGIAVIDDRTGETVYRTKDKAEAAAIVAGEKPVPEAAEAA